MTDYVVIVTMVTRYGIKAETDSEAIAGVEKGEGAPIPGTSSLTRVAVLRATPPAVPVFVAGAPAPKS